jgi:plastocyanin
VTVALEARDFVFAPVAVSAPAGAPFSIAFADRDAAIPHNVTITSSAGASVFSGAIITGVSSINYAVPALTVGDYRLGCIVHPDMTGTLSVR